MKKKTRNTLTDLLQEVDINNLKEPEIEPKKKLNLPNQKKTSTT